MPGGPSEGVDVLLLPATRSEPAGTLPAKDLLEYGASLVHPVVYTKNSEGSSRGSVQTGIRELVSEEIILPGLGVVVLRGGVIPEASWVEGSKVEGGLTVDHPVAEVVRGSGPPGNPYRGTGAEPIVAQARCRAEKHVSVRWMANRTMDSLLNAHLTQDRHTVKDGFQPWLDAVVVGWEQVVICIPRSPLLPHRVGIALLVDTE